MAWRVGASFSDVVLVANILRYVTPEIVYFYYENQHFFGSKYPINIQLYLTVYTLRSRCRGCGQSFGRWRRMLQSGVACGNQL